MKIQRERLLEIIKEEIDWARQARPSVQEALQADTITRLENLMMDLQDEGSSLVGVLETIIDQIKKDEGLQEQEVSPWQKLASMLQEAGALQEAMDTESVVQQIEAILNELSSQGLDNEGLKKILNQIIHDIDKGFVGERT